MLLADTPVQQTARREAAATFVSLSENDRFGLE
jgi:hypothetical protein